jgi:hypothetical protein
VYGSAWLLAGWLGWCEEQESRVLDVGASLGLEALVDCWSSGINNAFRFVVMVYAHASLLVRMLRFWVAWNREAGYSGARPV